MALFDTIDIPAGLEDLFNALFAVGNNGTSLQTIVHPTVASPIKRAMLNNKSLFVMLEPIWLTLSGEQQDAWGLYWSTLPFGSHSGADGWPGSRYSAFVYENAKCYRLGLPWMLWPPSFNMIYNGDFSSGADGWTNFGVTFAGGHCIFTSLHPNGEIITASGHRFDFSAGHTYRIEMYLGAGTGNFNWGIDFNGPPHPDASWNDAAGAGALSHDVAFDDDATYAGFFVQANGAFSGYVATLAVYDLGVTFYL